MNKCILMVKTHPKKGAIDRHLPNHRCGHPEWKDGFCKQHHPDTIKEAEDGLTASYVRRKAREEAKLRFTEENCVMFLLEKGYRIDKPHREGVI